MVDVWEGFSDRELMRIGIDIYLRCKKLYVKGKMPRACRIFKQAKPIKISALTFDVKTIKIDLTLLDVMCNFFFIM
jgi:hypothetical protein